MEYKEIFAKRKKKNDELMSVDLDELIKATGWTISEAADILKLTADQKKMVLSRVEKHEEN